MSVKVVLESTQFWATGGNGKITITNVSGSALDSWTINITGANFEIVDLWNLKLAKNGGSMAISGPDWAQGLANGATISSGFSYNGQSDTLSCQCDAPITIIGPQLASSSPPAANISPISVNQSAKKIFGYFPEWGIYSKEFTVDKIPAEKITHLMYAFMVAQPSKADYDLLKANYAFPINPYNESIPEGTLTTHDKWAALEKPNGGYLGNIGALKALKAKYPHLKVIISVGGWSLSWNLSKIIGNPSLRTRLIQSATEFIVAHGFDGLDLDWEFVGVKGPAYNYVDEVNDGMNLLKFMKELRAEFDLKSPGKHLEIMAATGCNPVVIANYTGAAQFMDYMLLMSYDFAGAWANTTGHHSAYYRNPADVDSPAGFNTVAAINNAVAAGFPLAKIGIGSPFYGRGWAKIGPYDAAIPIFGKSLGGGATPYNTTVDETGLSSYKFLWEKIKDGTLAPYYDDVAQAAYAFGRLSTNSLIDGPLWTYESTKSARYKAQKVVNDGLAGILVWELSQDLPITNPDSLLSNIYDELNKAKSPAIEEIMADEGNIEAPTEPSSGQTGTTDASSGQVGSTDTSSGQTSPIEPSSGQVEPQLISFDGLNLILVNNSDKDFILKPKQGIKLL
jgi:GH18 family chitinase